MSFLAGEKDHARKTKICSVLQNDTSLRTAQRRAMMSFGTGESTAQVASKMSFFLQGPFQLHVLSKTQFSRDKGVELCGGGAAAGSLIWPRGQDGVLDTLFCLRGALCSSEVQLFAD